MKVRIGTLVMRCLSCQGEEWRPSDATAPLSLDSEVVCLECGCHAMCADLELQLPLDLQAAA